MEMRGIVKWFDVRKGFGFITDEEGMDYFVHYSEIQGDGFKKLRDGQAVSFMPGEDEKGRCLARFVSVVNEFGEEGPGAGENRGDGEAAGYGSGQDMGDPGWEGPEFEGSGTEDRETVGPDMEDGAGEPEGSESEKAKGARGGRRKARAEETEKTEETAWDQRYA